MISLTGCHTLRSGKIRYKKVPQDIRTEQVVDSGSTEVTSKESQQTFGDKTRKQAVSRAESENIGISAETQDHVLSDGMKRNADQGKASSNRTTASFEKVELTDLSQSKSKETVQKTQADPKKERERKKRRKKIIEVAFVALVILSLLAATGIFGEVAAIIGIIVAGALLLMVIIVLIYNYSQGS